MLQYKSVVYPHLQHCVCFSGLSVSQRTIRAGDASEKGNRVELSAWAVVGDG